MTREDFLATVLFSQGVPMICHGDELGRTQGGNNNAYCQDNEITWIDWDLDEQKRKLLDFTVLEYERKPRQAHVRMLRGGARGAGVPDDAAYDLGQGAGFYVNASCCSCSLFFCLGSRRGSLSLCLIPAF